MLTPKFKKAAMITTILIISSATLAFAHGRWNWNNGADGDGPGRGYGMGHGPRGYYSDFRPNGPGDRAGLTDEQIAKIDAAREKFLKETETLRHQIRDKRLALGDALNAETPDKDQVLNLRKELSKLEDAFDEIAIQHRLEMHDLYPEGIGRGGWGRGPGRGFDRGYCGR